MVASNPLVVDLTAPYSWLAGVQSASAGWPSGVHLQLQRPGDGSRSDAVVHVVAADSEPSPLASAPPQQGRSRAIVVGRHAMHEGRFTSWAQRTLDGTVGADHPALAGWDHIDTSDTFPLPADARSSHEARRVVRALAAGLACVDDVVLATSELAANALQHGGGARTLATSMSPLSIVVGITDSRPDALPSVLSLRGAAASGRGMAIIDAIAHHWGITIFHDHKVVWCEFGIRPHGE
jgi:anti-sigma regulatory factor (Ser/Thr protein kinase)